MTKLISLILTVIMLMESVPVLWLDTLTVDAGERGDAVSTYATGFLYGLAEKGVPDKTMTDSLDIASVSQKVIDGLQHPTGDIDRVADQLSECDYRVTYLQDAFDTWYYCDDEIMEMRKNGTYDWESFLYERYLPIVEEKVRILSSKDYADELVYCIFNECDNGIWFGDFDGENCLYNEKGRENFYKAWKITYELVKSIDPDAKIGGPGFCDYETGKIRDFMEYAVEKGCVPDVMIYHELAWWSSADWMMHYNDYRNTEKELGVKALPIIVTEYGTMEECGNPAALLRYIVNMEKSNVYGNMAYWRLSNNLNDTCADDNSPNSNWWLYRKYAELEGTTLYASSLKKGEKDDGWADYTGLAVLSENEEEINIIAKGSDDRRAVRIKNLDKTALGKNIDVTVECVYYSGLTGIVSEPVILRQYTAQQSMGNININVPATDNNAVYFIKLSKHQGEIDVIRNRNIPVRYEFEKGKLLGDAYTYDSAYATTGEQKGMCGGFEKDGDGVRIKIFVKDTGLYNLGFIYGKHNDGQGAKGRDYGTANLKIDKNTSELTLENTIKSEYTSLKNVQLELSAGIHTVELSHKEGTFVLDSLILSAVKDKKEIQLLEDSDDGREYLAVAPEDGYYNLFTDAGESDFTVDGAKGTATGENKIYLRRGLNKLVFEEKCSPVIMKSEEEMRPVAEIAAKDITVSDGAEILTDKYGNTYLGSVSSKGGKGTFTVNTDEKGDYRVTLLYSNNSEGGYHDYNVDLIERFVTVSVNGGEGKDIYCRNTYSDYTYKTVTFTLSLEKGENEISFYNSGSYEFAGITAEAPCIKNVSIHSVIS